MLQWMKIRPSIEADYAYASCHRENKLLMLLSFNAYLIQKSPGEWKLNFIAVLKMGALMKGRKLESCSV